MSFIFLSEFLSQAKCVFEKEGISEGFNKMPKKFYLFVPKSLEARGFLDKQHNNIRKLKTAGEILKNHAGQLKRPYNFNIYSVTDSLSNQV